ncbi:ABC transporter permease, partial [Streptococcus mitis]|uniref:ABC transporter permease n=1 Tax=Streptococcus mitis TaxID=28037 RepID=UPI0021B5C1A8
MLSLIKIELNKVSKSKLFCAWLGTIFIVLGITGIIIMGLGTDNKLGEFVGQNADNIRIADKWEGWAIATSLFASLFTKAAFLIFESYLLSTIIIEEFKRRTIFQLFSYPVSKIKLLWGKVLTVILISF